MSEFDNIIGYASVKEELMQICDMVQNMDVYEKLGAKMPKGLILHGQPGVGKSLMARSFVKESGRKSYVVRRNKPDGDFVNEVKNIFTEAARNVPSVILLDDMDKYVVEENGREEYVAVQACIDDVAFSDVFVIATANDLSDMPDSLMRAGRFDRKIYVGQPKADDAVKIIRHYMAQKSFVRDLNIDDIVKMMSGHSCAEFETVLNEAAIYAGFERSGQIKMEHIVRVVLRENYGVDDSLLLDESVCLEKVACHEAGHVVISEILKPGSVGISSVRGRRGTRDMQGFTSRCPGWKTQSHAILTALGGKAATEIKYGGADEGAASDIQRALSHTMEYVAEIGARGISALDIDQRHMPSSNTLRARQEDLIYAEIERHLSQVKEMLTKNMSFLDAVTAALLERSTLVHSDIQQLREAYGTN